MRPQTAANAELSSRERFRHTAVCCGESPSLADGRFVFNWGEYPALNCAGQAKKAGNRSPEKVAQLFKERVAILTTWLW
jgi:hypothetical protein